VPGGEARRLAELAVRVLRHAQPEKLSVTDEPIGTDAPAAGDVEVTSRFGLGTESP